MNNIYYKNKYLKYKNKYLIKKIKLNLGGSIETTETKEPWETTYNRDAIVALAHTDEYNTVVNIIEKISDTEILNNSDSVKNKLNTILLLSISILLPTGRNGSPPPDSVIWICSPEC